MIAPDFKTSVAEVLSYGMTTGFLIKDITGAYDASDNPHGWGIDGGFDFIAPIDIKYAFILITPYKGTEIKVMLEMSNTNDNLYWKNLLDHLGNDGITLDDTIVSSFPDGHWIFKSLYYAGYYKALATPQSEIEKLIKGEIVTGSTSGATAYFVEHSTSGSDYYIHLCPIAGSFVDGETLTGKDSSASVTLTILGAIVGDYSDTQVYSYTNDQSILTDTRNTVRKLALDIRLPDINNKHVDAVAMADLYLEALDDAVEVGQINNYEAMFNFLTDFIEKIDQTYCRNGND